MMFTTDMAASTLTAIPDLTGPLQSFSDSYPFSTASRQVQPLDLNEFGYVDEEFFAAGTAHVYAPDCEGDPIVAEPDIPCVNRILVRRPADPAKASGTVWVDIMNASNGFDVEDH